MNAVGATLLWCVIQVTAVAAAAVAAYLLVFRGGATARAGVALAGLAMAALLAPLAFSPWPRWEAGAAAASTDESVTAADTSAPSRERPAVPRPAVEPINVWSAAWSGFVDGVANPPAAEPVAGEEPRRGVRWPVVVAWLFAAAAAAGLLRLALGAWAVKRSIRRAKPVYDPALFGLIDVLRAELSCVGAVEVRESGEVATAATAGWRKPVLLLPPDWRDWTEAERRAVVAHELAHVKRRDYLAALVAQAALAVHFYHPLLHWLAGRVRLEQELAADALAASVSGGRAAYLRTLAELALRRSDGRVAWPARAFLPSRRTFLRRIEMLRDPRRAVDRPAPLLRGVVAGGLLLFGLVVAGVRPEPAAAQSAALQGGLGGGAQLSGQPADSPAVPAEAVGSPAVYMPATALFVATLRPAALLDDPAVKPFAAQIEQGVAESKEPAWVALRDAGVTPRTIDSLAVGFLQPPVGVRSRQSAAFAVRVTKGIDRGVIEKAAKETKTTFGGIVYRLDGDVFAALPNETTALVAEDEATLAAMMVGGQINRAASPWPRIEERLGATALAWLVDVEAARDQVQKEMGPPGSPQAVMFAPVMPLLSDAKFAGVSLSLSDGPGLRGYAECNDESAAKRVAETLRALVTLGKNTLRQVKGQQGGRTPQEQQLAKMFLPLAEQLLNSAKVESEGAGVTLTAESGGSTAVALGLILPAVQQSREAARRAQSMNNLKQIAIAFHNYNETHGHLPPAVIEENGVARSWRVELLPFLEQDALYRQYRKDQPWDSEANRKVLEQMPAVFKDPSDSSGPTSTSYFVLTGSEPIPVAGPGEKVDGGRGAKGTVFSDKPVPAGEGPKFQDFTDGLSNTLLVVEAKRDVPWTKPEDVPFDPGQADELIGELGGNHPGVFLAAIADGSVRAVSNGAGQAVDAGVFRALVTPAGGEPIGTLP